MHVAACSYASLTKSYHGDANVKQLAAIFLLLKKSFHAVLELHWKAYHMDRVKRIWYLSPMRAAKVQARLPIHAVSPEPPLLAIQAVGQEEPSYRKPDP